MSYDQCKLCDGFALYGGLCSGHEVARLTAAVTALQGEVEGHRDAHGLRSAEWLRVHERALAAEAEVERLRRFTSPLRHPEREPEAADNYWRLAKEWKDRAETAEAARDEALAALRGLFEWGARGHNPNDLEPWRRASAVLASRGDRP